MDALILIAHGSRRVSSNAEVNRLAEQLRARAGARYCHVTYAFLELAEPPLAQAAEACVEAGAGRVVILPYFLAAGRHVVSDIPEQLAPIQTRYPQVTFEVMPHLGAAEGVAELLLGMAEPKA